MMAVRFRLKPYRIGERSGNLNMVRQDRQARRLHDRMLGKLFCIKCACASPQNEPVFGKYQSKIAHPPPHLTSDSRLQLAGMFGHRLANPVCRKDCVHDRNLEDRLFPSGYPFVAPATSLGVCERTFSDTCICARGVFTVRTGHGALRTTFSATLPISSRPRPVRPCVPNMIKSHSVSTANCRISAAGFPSTSRCSTQTFGSRG